MKTNLYAAHKTVAKPSGKATGVLQRRWVSTISPPVTVNALPQVFRQSSLLVRWVGRKSAYRL